MRSIINAMFDQKNRTLYILHVYFEGEEIIRNVNTTALYALDVDCAIVHSCAHILSWKLPPFEHHIQLQVLWDKNRCGISPIATPWEEGERRPGITLVLLSSFWPPDLTLDEEESFGSFFFFFFIFFLCVRVRCVQRRPGQEEMRWRGGETFH